MQFLFSFRYVVASQHVGPVVSAVTPQSGAYFFLCLSLWVEKLVQDAVSAGRLTPLALDGLLWSPVSGH